MRRRRARAQLFPAREPAEVVRVEKMIPGGAGMGRLKDGRALFIHGAFVGDDVSIQSIRGKKSFAEAVEHLTRAGEGRREAPCPVASRCGGCDWISWNEKEQAAGKQELVLDALAR